MLAAILVAGPGIAPSPAAEIEVLTAGAMKAVILELLPEFQRQSGHRVMVDNDTAGGLNRRIGGGETFDLAVITPGVVDELAGKGKIVAGTRTNLARVGIGVAVKDGAAKPDIGTTVAFKAALMAAETVAYIEQKAGGSSGIYFDKLIEKLEIADQVRAKARLLAGGYVAELVAKGQAELAVHRISEILPVKGVTLVGPLPAEVQNCTTYAAGIGAGARDAAAARALLVFLAGPHIEPVLKSRGMERP